MGEKGRTRTFVIISILVVVTALSIWLRRRELAPDPLIEPGSATVTPANPEEREPAANSGDKEEGPGAVNTPQPEPISDPEFRQWIKKEAQQLDNVNVDSAQKEIEIRKVVSKMTSQQWRHLLQTIKNPKAPAGEKILSTYLLVQGGSKTHKELGELISAPLEEDQPHEPHSVEEMRGIREKSLRIMAIDGLFSQAQNEPSARTALARAAQDASDPTIKAYAEDKLRQLQ